MRGGEAEKEGERDGVMEAVGREVGSGAEGGGEERLKTNSVTVNYKQLKYNH